MSDLASQYETFFTSPAGISLLTWLQEQRTTEHERGEDAQTEEASFAHSKTALTYREVLQHIDSMMTVMNSSPYSSKEGAVPTPSPSLLG